MQQIPQLRVPIADAERAINHALTTGNNFNFAGWSGSQLTATRERLDTWYTQVSETLRGLFTNPEMAEQFMAVSHDIASVEREDARHLPVRHTFDHRMAWLRRLQENLGIYAPAGTTIALVPNASPVDFDKVSFKWLFEHLPAKIWLTIGAGILILLGLGVSLGQLSVVQEFIGKKRAEQALRLTSEEFKARVDELTKGHNQRREKLIDAIIHQEDQLSNALTNIEEKKQAIINLQKEMDKEEATYQSDLRGLSSLNASK